MKDTLERIVDPSPGQYSDCTEIARFETLKGAEYRLIAGDIVAVNLFRNILFLSYLESIPQLDFLHNIIF